MNKLIRERLVTGKSLRRFTALVLLVLVGRASNASGQTVTTVYSFGNSPDGSGPNAGLVQGSDGNFYGTTSQGGNTNVNNFGYGTVFRITPAGSFTNLYIFGNSPFDGLNPDNAGLLQGSDGNFYGTTFYGGTHNNGTVFRISTSGTYTNLHSVGTVINDGTNPEAGLVQGSDGNFYGTTFNGGKFGDGTVFRITAAGTYTNLYSFGGPPGFGEFGYSPSAGLVQGSDGNFYGTTEYAGMGGRLGYGSIFRISPSASVTNPYILGSSFTDGVHPFAGLVQGSDGSFYGTTQSGGNSGNGGVGTVFRISPDGNYTNLYSFGGFPDGRVPTAGLVQGSDGNFYGTTSQGGTSSSGTVFQISPSGSYTNLYSFGSSPGDGTVPYAGLVQGNDGNFYGTTFYGGLTNINPALGSHGYGTVFKLTVPLNPPPYPINQITGIQLFGTNVVFNIPSVAYETYQLQFTCDPTSGIWSNVPVSVTNSIGALLTLTNFGGALQPQGFYRFDITP